MSSRTRLSFSIKLNSQGETLKIQISDPSGLQADNLALATWGSSEILANILHTLPIDLNNNNGNNGNTSSGAPQDGEDALGVLELGAGTGLVGLSAACIWRTDVVLTDLPPLLPAVEANIALNRELLKDHGGRARVGMLDWSKPDRIAFVGGKSSDTKEAPGPAGEPALGVEHMKARVIVTADTVYSEEHPALLVNAIQHRLAPSPDARLVMCYPLRIGYLDHIRDLWERLEEGGFECIQEGREELDGSWDEDTPYEWCVWRWKSRGEGDGEAVHGE